MRAGSQVYTPVVSLTVAAGIAERPRQVRTEPPLTRTDRAPCDSRSSSDWLVHVFPAQTEAAATHVSQTCVTTTTFSRQAKAVLEGVLPMPVP